MIWEWVKNRKYNKQKPIWYNIKFSIKNKNESDLRDKTDKKPLSEKNHYRKLGGGDNFWKDLTGERHIYIYIYILLFQNLKIFNTKYKNS